MNEQLESEGKIGYLHPDKCPSCGHNLFTDAGQGLRHCVTCGEDWPWHLLGDNSSVMEFARSVWLRAREEASGNGRRSMNNAPVTVNSRGIPTTSGRYWFRGLVFYDATDEPHREAAAILSVVECRNGRGEPSVVVWVEGAKAYRLEGGYVLIPVPWEVEAASE